jgi:formylmethanofuran dehydrogenase subunit D
MNEADMKERGLRSGDVVEVRSGERVLSGLEALDRQSGTPAYKSIAIEIRKLG